VYLSLIGLVYSQISVAPVLAQVKPAKEGNSSAGDAKPAATTQHKILYELSNLPLPVREMRDHIFAAINAGQIEELGIAIEWNELRPTFAAEALQDPISYFRTISGDGKGLEILAILAKILKAGYVAQPLGTDIENNLVYVWPYFAEIPLRQLTEAQKVELLQIIPAQSFNQMMKMGKYTGYRLSIGADGTWHEFLEGN